MSDVGRIEWAPDYKQPSLFPASPKCDHKGCPSRPSLCKFEADVAHGTIDRFSRRPKTCLQRVGQTDLPESY